MKVFNQIHIQVVNYSLWSAVSARMFSSRARSSHMVHIVWFKYKLPRQQKFRVMNGAHLASSIREELARLCSLAPVGLPNSLLYREPNLGPIKEQDVCRNFALTVGKFVFSNSGNFRAKANPPKPRSCPKRPFGQWMGKNSSSDWDEWYGPWWWRPLRSKKPSAVKSDAEAFDRRRVRPKMLLKVDQSFLGSPEWRAILRSQ